MLFLTRITWHRLIIKGFDERALTVYFWNINFTKSISAHIDYVRLSNVLTFNMIFRSCKFINNTFITIMAIKQF